MNTEQSSSYDSFKCHYARHSWTLLVSSFRTDSPRSGREIREAALHMFHAPKALGKCGTSPELSKSWGSERHSAKADKKHSHTSIGQTGGGVALHQPCQPSLRAGGAGIRKPTQKFPKHTLKIQLLSHRGIVLKHLTTTSRQHRSNGEHTSSLPPPQPVSCHSLQFPRTDIYFSLRRNDEFTDVRVYGLQIQHHLEPDADRQDPRW